MKGNLEYYRKLDARYERDNHRMVNLTRDFAFKSVFGFNKNILKKMLISVLKLGLNPDKSEITLNNIELPKDMEKEYKKSVDILIFLEPNLTISVEINRSRYEDVKRRNFIYLAKIYSLALKSGEDYNALKDRPFYQLNINANKDDKDYGEDIYHYTSDRTGKEVIDSAITFVKNIEFYRDLYYTKHEALDEDKLWLVMLSSENYEEMYKLASKLMTKKEVRKFMGDVERINIDNYVLTQEEWDALDKIQEYDTRQNALREGKEEGLKEGRKTEKIETAKKMLERKMSLDEIVEITNLTKKEVEEISNE